MMHGLTQDLRLALRQFRRNPGFTTLVVLTLAPGIGANTAIFSVVNAVLLKPLPYQDANRLVMIWQQNPHRGWFQNNVSGANFLDWKTQNHVFSDIAAFDSRSFNLSGDPKPEEIAGERVTTNLLSMLGVQPLHGRLFLPEEERQDKAAVVISYGLWRRHFGADPTLVSKSISLNGERYPIVGILPASFDDIYAARFASTAQLWISGIQPFPTEREFHEYRAIARLKPGVTLAQAQAEMDTIANRLETQYPESSGWGIGLVKLHDQVTGYTRPALLVLLGAVGLVLLIACANVANLLLVRATGRERETAIRAALGASRAQLVRQFLVESTLLAIVGATSGVLLAACASGFLVRLSPPDTPPIEGAGISAFVLLFTFVLAIATGIVFGLAPALGSSRPRVNEALKESGRSTTSGTKSRKLRDFLIVCEFGLALSLLIGAGLMLKTLQHLRGVDIGINSNHVLSFRVPLQDPRYQEPRPQAEFFRQILSQIAAIPSVESATVSRGIPMYGWAGWGFVTADNPNPRAGEVPDANYVVIAPAYFQTLQIPLRQGRQFTDFDTPGTQPVAIVSEYLSQKYWPGQDPIGKRLKASTDANDNSQPWLTVVGVAGNVRTRGQYAEFQPEIYVPYTQYPWVLTPRHILVRTTGDPLAIVPEIRRQVAALDKNVPLSEIQTMNEVVAGPIQQSRTLMWLLAAFASLALVLAMVGIYSVISYAVSQRTHEIGVRMALGATGGDVAGLVVQQALLLTSIGVAAGLLGSFGITRLFTSLPFEMRRSLLFDVRPTDPWILTAVSGILCIVALLASFIPARRAAKVDPLVALRYE
ncbi:MAG: ABC transporter permease [Acidobacteria bacterium]|nr:ABC transporter permease [Acidobacteriota bacterium]